MTVTTSSSCLMVMPKGAEIKVEVCNKSNQVLSKVTCQLGQNNFSIFAFIDRNSKIERTWRFFDETVAKPEFQIGYAFKETPETGLKTWCFALDSTKEVALASLALTVFSDTETMPCTVECYDAQNTLFNTFYFRDIRFMGSNRITPALTPLTNNSTLTTAAASRALTRQHSCSSFFV